VTEIRDTPQTWQVVGGREHFVGRILRVRSDDVLMPTGSGEEAVNREYVVHPGSVGTIALDDQGRILMIRQYRHPVRHLLWEIPAGLRDVAGEPLWRTAERELAEEAGVRALTWNTLVDLYPSPGMSDERIRVFLARDVSAIPADELDFERVHEEADMPVVWVPLEQAVARVLAGEIHNSLAVTAILAAHAARDSGFGDLRGKDVPET